MPQQALPLPPSQVLSYKYKCVLVGYAPSILLFQNRDDQSEYERNKRRRSPTPPRIEPFSPTTFSAIGDKIKSDTEFSEAAAVSEAANFVTIPQMGHLHFYTFKAISERRSRSEKIQAICPMAWIVPYFALPFDCHG